MSDSPSNEPIAEPSAAKPVPSRWAARLGLVLAGLIVVGCFGLLIAAGHAGQ